MKKLLISSVALLAIADASNAANFDLKIGGFVDAQAGFVDSDRVETDQIGLQTDSEIHVTVGGQSGSLSYGAVVELEADASLDSENADINADKSYLYLQGGFGRIELGTNTDAADALDVNTGNFARATGGVDGDFNDFAQVRGSTNAQIRPDGPIAERRDDNEDANRVTYYTKRTGGVQIGASYTPQLASKGQDLAGIGAQATETSTDAFSGGINYSKNWNGFGVNASATAETANSQGANAKDAFAHKYGLSVNSEGVTVGASYGIIDEGIEGAGDGDYFDVGIAYETGPFGVSATYFKSDSSEGDDEFENIVLGADYVYAPGAAAYAEVSIFSAEDDADNEDEGTVVIVGTQLGF